MWCIHFYGLCAKFSQCKLKCKNILYAYFEHILNKFVHWPWVLMKLGNILKLVWGLLCFWAAQLLLSLSLNYVNFVHPTKLAVFVNRSPNFHHCKKEQLQPCPVIILLHIFRLIKYDNLLSYLVFLIWFKEYIPPCYDLILWV